MKNNSLFTLLFLVFLTPLSHARIVDIEVYGMTCAFCAETLERQFQAMDHVSKVGISLKHKKVRLTTDKDLPSITTIKQTVLNAGFTPIKVTTQPNETK